MSKLAVLSAGQATTDWENVVLRDNILVMRYDRTHLRPIRQKSLCGGVRPSFTPPSLGASPSLPFIYCTY